MPENKIIETPKEEILAKIAKVKANADKWNKLEHSKKLVHLKKMQDNLNEIFEEWGKACSESRGLENYELFKGVGYVMGPGVFGLWLNQLIQTYESLVSTNAPPKPVAERKVNNSKIAQVLPYTTLDSIAGGGQKVELWMEPGKDISQGKILSAKPGLVGILGAGNYEAPVDILTKMFLHQKVAVYKSHPNLAHSSAKYIRQLMKSLIDEDFLAVIEGTIEPGQTLIASDSVDELLMTGGAATFDRIVWGDDPNAKQSGQPLVTKPFEAELGAVSPWVLVPGQWSDADLKHHAEYLVSCKMMNSGAICASPQVVVYDEQWPQIDKFQQLVEKALADFPELPVFYGGSCQRATSIASDTKGKVSWPKGKPVGDRNEKGERAAVRPGIVKDVKDPNATVLNTEVFAPLLSFISVKSDTGAADTFLPAAVKLCNEHCFGSLSMSIMIDGATQKQYATELDNAIDALKWGSIGINTWGGSLVFHAASRWGAYPGLHSIKDVQSGLGEIGNCRLYDHAAKSVAWEPFNHPGHFEIPSEKKKALLYRLAWFGCRPGYWRLMGVLSSAVLGW